MIKEDPITEDILGHADDLTPQEAELVAELRRQNKKDQSGQQLQNANTVPPNADKIIARLAEKEKRQLPRELYGLAVFADIEGNPPNVMRLNIDHNNPWSQLLVPMYFLQSDPRMNAGRVFTGSEISHSSKSTENPFDAAFALIKHSINATMKEAREMHQPDPEAISDQVKQIIIDALKLDTWPISVAIYVTGRGGFIDVMTGYVLDYIKAKPVPYALQEMERQLREFQSWNERIIRSEILSQASAFGIFATVTETTAPQKEILTKLEEKNIDPMLAQVAKTIEIRTKRMKESAQILHEMYHLIYNQDFSDEVQKQSRIKKSSPRYIIERRKLRKQIETIIAIIHRPKTDIWEEVYKKKLGQAPPDSTREKLRQIIEENYTERSLNLLGLRKSTVQEEIIDFSRDRTLVVDIGGSNYVQIKYYDTQTDKMLTFEEIYAVLEQETNKYKSKLQRAHRNQVDEKPTTKLTQIMRRFARKKQTEEENPIQLARIKEYLVARKNTAAVMRELFNFHDKNAVIRSKRKLKQFISAYANTPENSSQVKEIADNIQLMSKADFSVVIDLGLQISDRVHGGECIAQLGTGSQTLVFTTEGDPVQLTNKDIVGRLYSGTQDKLKPANTTQRHFIHSICDGADAVLIGKWEQTEVFKSLQELANDKVAQLGQTPIPVDTVTPIPLGLYHDALTDPEKELTVFTEPKTTSAFEITAESELPEHLIKTPHELNDQLLELVKTTIKYQTEQELQTVQVLVNKKDRSKLVQLLRHETDLFIDRVIDEEFQNRFEAEWKLRVKKFTDETSYYEIEKEKNELEERIQQEVFALAQDERSVFVKKMNKVIKKIYHHQQNLVKHRIQHQENQQNIVNKFDKSIEKLEQWKENLEAGVTDSDREMIQKLLTQLTQSIKIHLVAKLERLNKQSQIGQTRLDRVSEALNNNPDFLSIPDAISCLEIQKDLELELEASRYIEYNQSQNQEIEVSLPVIQDHLNELLKLKYGNPDVEPDHQDYSPILKMYGKVKEGGINLGRMNTAGISGVGMLFWAIANNEIPAVRMLVDLKQTKAGGRLEYLTLSATSTTAERLSAFNKMVNTNKNVDATEVYNNWSLLMQEMMQIAGFNYQLLVQHALKGVSYATTVTAGSGKTREKLLNFLTKNLNEKLNSLYYVPHQLSFLHTDPHQNEASGFYSVPAPENLHTSVGAVYNHDPDNKKLSYSFRFPVKNEDLVIAAQEMGINLSDATEEQRIQIQELCEANLAKRADHITQWQTFAHAMTKFNKEKITKLCESWNAQPNNRDLYDNSFLNFMIASVVEQSQLES